MSASDVELVCLSGGLVLPRPAIDAVLDLEHAGHRLTLDGEDIVIEPAKGIPLDPNMLAALRRWKPACRALMGYVADDSHLFTDQPGAATPERRAS